MKTLLAIILLAPLTLQAQQPNQDVSSTPSPNSSQERISIFGALESVIEDLTPLSNIKLLSISPEDADSYKIKFLGDGYQMIQEEIFCYVVFSSFTNEGPAAVSLRDCFMAVKDCTPVRRISFEEGVIGSLQCKE